MIKLTSAQLETLKLFPKGFLLTRGRFGNVCAELTKKGLLRFDGYESGKRKFRLTDEGQKVIEGKNHK